MSTRGKLQGGRGRQAAAAAATFERQGAGGPSALPTCDLARILPVSNDSHAGGAGWRELSGGARSWERSKDSPLAHSAVDNLHSRSVQRNAVCKLLARAPGRNALMHATLPLLLRPCGEFACTAQ